MRAHVLSIGSELILGHITDTNATYLAQELFSVGIELIHVTQVGDDRTRLADTIRAAIANANLIICTGGIGPTDDDVTREAIADVAGEVPAIDPALLETVRAFFAGRGIAMPERNAKQAWLIPAAEALPNPVGTAPGWFVRLGDAFIVAMPGVPREMFRMWREQALPRIRPHLPQRVFVTSVVKTIGIGESAAAQLLGDLIQRPHPIVATYAKDDGIHVHITATADIEADARHLVVESEREVVRRLDRYTYSTAGTSLSAALLALLRERELTVAVAERGTGGRFGALLSGDPNGGEVLAGTLALPRSATSDPATMAAALAAQAKSDFRTSLGVGIVADVAPNDQMLYEGTGTVALVGPFDRVDTFPLRASYDEIGRRAALNAADLLRRAILGIAD